MPSSKTLSEDEDASDDTDQPQSDSFEDSLSSSSSDNTSELGQIRNVLEELFDLSRAIHRSGILSRFSKLANFTETVDLGGQAVDIGAKFRDNIKLVVKRRHPSASPSLIQRLVDTIYLRHQNFVYLQARESQSSRGLYEKHDVSSDKESSPHTPLQRIRVIDPSHAPLPQLEPLLEQVKNTDKMATNFRSGNPFAASTANADKVLKPRSVRSSSSTVFQFNSGELSQVIPRPPKVLPGHSHAKCPYCFLVCPAAELKGSQWLYVRYFIKQGDNAK